MAADEDSDEEHLHVDRVPRRVFSRFIYLLVFFTGIGSFLIGFDGGNLSGALIFLKEDFSLNYGWQSALVSATITAAGSSASLPVSWLNVSDGSRSCCAPASSMQCPPS